MTIKKEFRTDAKALITAVMQKGSVGSDEMITWLIENRDITTESATQLVNDLFADGAFLPKR